MVSGERKYTLVAGSGPPFINPWLRAALKALGAEHVSPHRPQQGEEKQREELEVAPISRTMKQEFSWNMGVSKPLQPPFPTPPPAVEFSHQGRHCPAKASGPPQVTAPVWATCPTRSLAPRPQAQKGSRCQGSNATSAFLKHDFVYFQAVTVENILGGNITQPLQFTDEENEH